MGGNFAVLWDRIGLSDIMSVFWVGNLFKLVPVPWLDGGYMCLVYQFVIYQFIFYS